MIEDCCETVEDDIYNKELKNELWEKDEDYELTRLTEMVRRHYLNYLEKQLHENLVNSNFNNKRIGFYTEGYDEICKNSIKKTAEFLEDKAVKACMIAKFYQRAMVKIISIVRRTTEEKKLLIHLEKCIQTKDECKHSTLSKETQTETGLLKNEPFNYIETIIPSVESGDTKNNISLDEKIEMFKKHLKKEKKIDHKSYPLKKNQKILKKQQQFHNDLKSYPRYYRHHKECHTRNEEVAYFSPTSSIISDQTTPTTLEQKQPSVDSSLFKYEESKVVENENSNDSVGIELARLFSEEKTELDEIFGIDPNDEPDDPQICEILKEIKQSKIINTTNSTEIKSKIDKTLPEVYLQEKDVQKKYIDLNSSVDLSKSIWPCELFRQRCILSESLARLIEEDLRWHDIIKWKYSELFGEDSDDEFTPCSPSIELNEVLIGSCIRRISPWVVKYLMKPMKDGLIGNRFLFKKLAKNLARSIIMENQYPDESIIKECVENFFCMHQSVMSAEDLEFDIPSISSSFQIIN